MTLLAILTPKSTATLTGQEEATMSRLAIAYLLAFAASAAHAQATSGQLSPTGTDATRPFLFDGRLRGDSVRQTAPANDHPASGTIIVGPKAHWAGHPQ